MVITIGYKIDSEHRFGPVLKCKDKRFVEKYGDAVHIPSRCLYRVMSKMSDYVNNELKEECLFEMED